jgi:hypothetical protein
MVKYKCRNSTTVPSFLADGTALPHTGLTITLCHFLSAHNVAVDVLDVNVDISLDFLKAVSLAESASVATSCNLLRHRLPISNRPTMDALANVSARNPNV